eukprot:15350501-Ditylum_brightwellii.AAC.1
MTGWALKLTAPPQPSTALSEHLLSRSNGYCIAVSFIEGTAHSTHRITRVVISPGAANLHDAYCRELTRLYMMIEVVESVCKYHNIVSGSITIACDGIEALKK